MLETIYRAVSFLVNYIAKEDQEAQEAKEAKKAQKREASAHPLVSRGIKVDAQGRFECPMCGWLHTADKKVCTNPKCGIRF